MGGTNTSLYTGNIDYINVPQTQDGHWTIPLSSIHVDSTVIDTSTPTYHGQLAAIDTGSSTIGGPDNEVDKIYANIKGSLRGTGGNAPFYAIRRFLGYFRPIFLTHTFQLAPPLCPFP